MNSNDKKPYKKAKTAEIPKKSTIRLNKYLSNAGLCSRREADEHIKMGLVEVNGKVVLEMGYQVKPNDQIKYDGAQIRKNPPVYVLLNKPKGFLATLKGGRMKKTVQELVRLASNERLLPVGDMGRPHTGLILLTNDDELREKLTRSQKIPMIYQVILEKNVNLTTQNKLTEGVVLGEHSYRLKALSHIEGKPKNEMGIEVHSLTPSTILKLFENQGNKVILLDRVVLGGLTKKELPRGNWRLLTTKEIGFLKMFP